MSKLSGITYSGVAVPVFYEYIPDDQEPANYIIFGSISDTDRSNLSGQATLASVQVKIHTWADKYNNGKAVANIANQVLQNINPNLGPTIDLSADGLQLFSTKKINDSTENWTMNNQRVYIDRTMIFQHNISQL